MPIEWSAKRVKRHLDLIERYYRGCTFSFLTKPTKEINRVRRKIDDNGGIAKIDLTIRSLLFLATHIPGKWESPTYGHWIRVIYFSGQRITLRRCPLVDTYKVLTDISKAYNGGKIQVADGFIVGSTCYADLTLACKLKFRVEKKSEL